MTNSQMEEVPANGMRTSSTDSVPQQPEPGKLLQAPEPTPLMKEILQGVYRRNLEMYREYLQKQIAQGKVPDPPTTPEAQAIYRELTAR